MAVPVPLTMDSSPSHRPVTVLCCTYKVWLDFSLLCAHVSTLLNLIPPFRSTSSRQAARPTLGAAYASPLLIHSFHNPALVWGGSPHELPDLRGDRSALECRIRRLSRLWHCAMIYLVPFQGSSRHSKQYTQRRQEDLNARAMLFCLRYHLW